MKIIFDGSVLVWSAVADKSYLFLEIGKGCEKAGEVTTDPTRLGGVVVDIEAIAKQDNVVLLEFLGAASIAVVMEKLQQLLMHELGMPIK